MTQSEGLDLAQKRLREIILRRTCTSAGIVLKDDTSVAFGFKHVDCFLFCGRIILPDKLGQFYISLAINLCSDAKTVTRQIK